MLEEYFLTAFIFILKAVYRNQAKLSIIGSYPVHLIDGLWDS